MKTREKKSVLKKLLAQRPVVLDGATGTELQKGGMPAGVCPELWAAAQPEALAAIQRRYFEAGADIVYSCTFGANRMKLAEFGAAERVRELNAALVAVARRSGSGLVAGDMGPTGQFIEPFGTVAFNDAVSVYQEQATALIAAGVDLLVIETMIDIQEARAALVAVREISDIPTLVTMTYERGGRTLNGTDPVAALITLQSLGADAVGCNCSTGPQDMAKIIAQMRPYATVPLAAKPNAGLPVLRDGRTFFDMGPEEFGAHVPALLAAGAALVGGCCGTTPAHIRAVKNAAASGAPFVATRPRLAALSSARRSLIFSETMPLVIVGECLNPTGKKALQQELREGNFALVQTLARDQEAAGAQLLDVNAGVAGIDEVKTLRDMVALLAVHAQSPLVIDSANPAAVEAALRVYPGRALINSISGETKKMEALLPLAAKYGALFILLPLEDGRVPLTAAERIAVVRKVFRAARRYGFTKQDFIVDGLVLTVSSSPAAARETLKFIAWNAQQFKTRTIAGLSNISFGLPNRPAANAVFLAMAQAAGLSAAILNPLREEAMLGALAGDVMMERDPAAARFIARAANAAAGTASAVPPAVHAAGESAVAVYRAVLEGRRQECAAAVSAALRAGIAADKLVVEVMIPAVTAVGELFDRKIYFLPQLLAGAETMKTACSLLEPYRQTTGPQAAPGVVILATVQGDIHDIGKNIVALLLKNHGFTVIDLGKDVAAAEILAQARRFENSVVGLSALMTTTMVRMPEIIEQARREGLACRFILGGAVVSESFARAQGAAYAADGVQAVRVIQGLVHQGV
ncbi:MAG: homocysteine S-methyltransferase family protein [Candidatus Omnitrophica bacterium]|nr:homocysteine S-methyltransferase family protein [Candidatus Omnitrophota bacterium]